jgi:diphthine methyl ester acylhydrolase
MTAIQSIYSCNLEQPPSCIEFVPGNKDYLLIGTYLLLENVDKSADNLEDAQTQPRASVQTRDGSIVVMKVESGSLKMIEKVGLNCGILDLHFSPLQTDTFAAANSTSSISFFKCNTKPEDGASTIQEICTVTPIAEDFIVLAIAWHPTNPNFLGASLSTGQVIILNSVHNLPESLPDMIVNYITSHSLETWTLSFSPYSNVLYSGSDSASISAVRFSEDPGNDPSQDIVSEELWKNEKIHEAGVTAILSICPDYLVTGSYDDNIRVLHVPSTSYGMQRPKVVANANLGGGVWRLKLLQTSLVKRENNTEDAGYLILASCMHAGTRILRLSRETSSQTWKIEILAKFEEHKSMNYGCDALIHGSEVKVISTSFYDRLVCLWSFNARQKG